MKLNTETQLETQGFAGMETNAFSIKGSAKAFRILLDGLYTNKIRAVVRELWTNAFDSHIEAGIGGVPFDCHLPSLLDPTFRVRDYGVSLTHDQVMHLYTTLFDSTKEDTNDQVGALGLGSKSPFAYTDTFTVVARLNGEKRTYLATIAADGTPQITHLDTVVSDEAQGLEVVLPAKPGDFRDFEHEARLLSVGFDPLPQVDGLEIEPYMPMYVGNDGSFAIFEPDVLPGSAQLSIRQGCVIYPVDDYNLNAPVRQLLKYGYQAVIDVPIGAVQITASREALSLDDTTKANVTIAVQGMIDVISDEVYEEADKCANHLAAVKYWFGSNKGETAFKITPKFRGKEIRNLIELKGGSGWEPLKGRHGKKRDEVNIRGFNVEVLDRLHFVTNYTDRKVIRSTARYRDFCDSGRNSALYTYYLTDPTPRQLERLMTLLGLSPTQIVWVGNITDPGPPERGYGGSGLKGALMGVSKITGNISWDRTTAIAEQDFLWFAVDRVSKDAVHANMADYTVLKALGMPHLPVYCFTPGAMKRHTPDEAKNLHLVMKQWRKTGEKEALDKIARYCYNQSLPLGLEAYEKPAVSYSEMQNATKLMGGSYCEAVRTASNKYDAEIAKLAERFPLLFNERDEAARKWYIAAVLAEESE